MLRSASAGLLRLFKLSTGDDDAEEEDEMKFSS
jgi:hypothetical protein